MRQVIQAAWAGVRIGATAHSATQKNLKKVRARRDGVRVADSSVTNHRSQDMRSW